MITFYSDRYQKLELFPAVSQDSTVYLTLSDGMHELRKRARNLDRVVFPLQKYTLYSLSLGGATPELAYLTDCDGLFDTGIRFLLPDGSLRKTQSCFQYHFTPPKGQLYAPCGLCYHRGYYHMFYSFAPFSADMFYLGHAVSRDLQHWHHLPLVLEPLPEMRQARHVAGGILSGSAVMNGNRMRLYFSQSVIRRESGEVVKEYILDAESHDLIHFSEGPSPVATLPSGFGPIFRSPKVTGSHMALGSARDGVGTVLLYRQENGGFSYVRPLVREKNAPYLAMPDLFPVGRTHALLASFPYTETDCKAYWYTGTFRDDRFRIRNRGPMDFGAAFYAPQTFLLEDRRLLFGVIPGVRSCLTLPREVFTRAGRLRMRPAAEVYRLQGDALHDRLCSSASLSLPHTVFLLRLQFPVPEDFLLQIGTAGLALRQSDGKLSLATGDTVRTPGVTPVHFVEIFADGDILEIFVNDGEAVGTVRLVENVFSLNFTAKSLGRLQLFSISPSIAEEIEPVDADAPIDTFDFVDYPFR